MNQIEASQAPQRWTVDLTLPGDLRPQLHPFCQQKPIVAYCREHGIVVQAYSPLIRGKMDHPVFIELAKKVRPRHVLRR